MSISSSTNSCYFLFKMISLNISTDDGFLSWTVKIKVDHTDTSEG